MQSVRVDAMPHGGFIVSEVQPYGPPDGHFYGPLFAATTLGEVNAFLADRLGPDSTFNEISGGAGRIDLSVTAAKAAREALTGSPMADHKTQGGLAGAAASIADEAAAAEAREALADRRRRFLDGY